MAIPFRQVMPPHDRALGGRVAPVTPLAFTLADTLAPRSSADSGARLAGCPTPGGLPPELTSPNDAASGTGTC